MASVTYIYTLEGDFYESSFSNSSVDFPPRNLAWCCTVCGEVWARAVMANPSPSSGYDWIFIEAPCRKCPHPYAISGLLTPKAPSKFAQSPMVWARCVQHLPEALLRRELDILLTHYEKQL